MTKDAFDWEKQDMYYLLVEDEFNKDFYLHNIYSTEKEAVKAFNELFNCNAEVIKGCVLHSKSNEYEEDEYET